MDRFGSRDIDDFFWGYALSKLYSIVSSHHGSRTAAQISLSDEFQRFIYNVMSFISNPHLDFSHGQEEYELLNDVDRYIASVLDLENLNLSINHCFDLIDHDVQPSKPLNEKIILKHLQKIFLKSIHHCNGDKAKYGMSHFFKCKKRWFKTVSGQTIWYDIVSKHLAAHICKCCGKDNGLYCKSNDMDTLNQLDHKNIPKLNDIEHMLIWAREAVAATAAEALAEKGGVEK